jgi:hypothetical protein
MEMPMLDRSTRKGITVFLAKEAMIEENGPLRKRQILTRLCLQVLSHCPVLGNLQIARSFTLSELKQSFITILDLGG